MAKTKQTTAGGTDTGAQNDGAGQGASADQQGQLNASVDGAPAQQGAGSGPENQSNTGADTELPAQDNVSSSAGAPVVAGKLIKARVLAACAYGKCDDVIEIDEALAESLTDVLDINPAAVAYAESLAIEQ